MTPKVPFARRDGGIEGVPGGGKGQMKWSAKAHGGSRDRLKSTVTVPWAAGAEGYRKRKR